MKYLVAIPLLAAAVAASNGLNQQPAAQPEASPGAQSPLARYMGFGHNPEAERRAYVADEAQRQQIIASCMRNAGYRYVAATSNFVRADELARSSRSRSVARPVDPNEAYRNSLGPEELMQYNLTLYGVPDPNDEQNLWDPSSPTGGGCWGEAIRGTVGVFEARTALQREFVEMRRSIDRDQRVVAEERKWSACMGESGFELDNFRELLSARANGGDIRGKPSMSRTEVDRAETASAACLSGTNYEDARRQATMDAETQFMNRNRAVLERLRHQP